MPMWAVASDVTFGTAGYLPVCHMPEDAQKVRASASLPGVSNIVDIDGHRYLDGGTTDAIPFGAALGLPGSRAVEGHVPASRALVVVTQDRDFVKHGTTEQMVMRSHRYDSFPYYIDALRSRAERYNACREELFRLEKEGKGILLAPKSTQGFSRIEKDVDKITALWQDGYDLGRARAEEIRAFWGKS